MPLRGRALQEDAQGRLGRASAPEEPLGQMEIDLDGGRKDQRVRPLEPRPPQLLEAPPQHFRLPPIHSLCCRHKDSKNAMRRLIPPSTGRFGHLKG